MHLGLRVAIVEPDKEPYVKDIGNNLRAMQDTVGGYIEITRDKLLPGMLLVVNEEGKIKGLPMNRCTGTDIICGTFFVCGSSKGDFRSLTEEQIKEVKLVYGLPKGDRKNNNEKEV